MSAPPGLVHDGMYRVSWVYTLAAPASPTVAEMNAGIALECQLTPDGLQRSAEDERIDVSQTSSTFSTERVGRTSFELALTLVRLDEAVPDVIDLAYHNLVKGTRGYLVVRDNRSSEAAWAEGDELEIYPVQVGTRSKATPAKNELQTFTLPLALRADPFLDVGAGGVGGYGFGGYGIIGYGG